MKPSIKLAICVIFLAMFFIETINMGATCKITNAICESKNASWVSFQKCRLRAVSRNKTVLNIEVTFIQPAYNIDLSVELMKKANGYKPWLIKHRVDACAFMRRVNHPVIKIVWDMIKDFSTVNHTCPYVGKQLLKDFFWDPRNLTLPIPTGEYVILMNWYFDKKLQFVSNVYFTFHQEFFRD